MTRDKPAKLVDPEAVALLESVAGPAHKVDAAEIVDRLLISMAMEMAALSGGGHCSVALPKLIWR
jgi:hypothetical protein